MKAMQDEIAELKDKINQIHGLKDQLGQILEHLTIISSKPEATTRDDGIQSSHPLILQPGTLQTRDLHHGNRTNQESPLYGMPINYEPLYEEGVEHETIPHDARGKPEFIQVPPGGRDENVVINRIPIITQPRALNVTLGGEPKAEVVAPTAAVLEADRAKDKLEVLEKRLRAIEGGSSHEFGDAVGLCLVPDVVIPPKFKVPDVEKYKGTTCPKSHLTMYCRKMAAHAHDEKLLIHCFQDSLGGVALNWYMHLEPTRVSSWKDLVYAFLKQYKYDIDMAPDRMQLQNMAKKSSETFKEYAQRWRELAAQVEPSLYKKEMIAMFIEALQNPFYEHVLGSVSSNFSDIVTIGERIKHGLKTGKIAQGSPVTTSVKKHGFNPGKKNEGEVQATSTAPYWGGFQQQYRPNHRPSSAFVACTAPSYSQNAHRPSAVYRPPFTPNNVFQPRVGGQNFNQAQNQGSGQKSNSAERVVNFTPIPMTYAELLPDLLKNALWPYVQQRLYNRHSLDILMPMPNVNTIVGKLVIQLRIVEL